jgi:hypothetical protein
VITIRAGVGHTYDFTKGISNTTTVFGTGFTSNASSAAVGLTRIRLIMAFVQFSTQRSL